MAAARVFAVMPAAGRGQRFGGDIPKQYMTLAGDTVLTHSLRLLLDLPFVEYVCLMVSAGDTRWRDCALAQDPRVRVLQGGETRAESVRNGLASLAQSATNDDWVLVHDVARPLCPSADIQRLRRELSDDAVGGLLALPVSDTVKQADSAQRVAATLDRECVWLAQTPQMFRYGLLRRALDQFPVVTDEAAAIEALGYYPRLVEGSACNLKITRAGDLDLARFYLQERSTP